MSIWFFSFEVMSNGAVKQNTLKNRTNIPSEQGTARQWGEWLEMCHWEECVLLSSATMSIRQYVATPTVLDSYSLSYVTTKQETLHKVYVFTFYTKLIKRRAIAHNATFWDQWSLMRPITYDISVLLLGIASVISPIILKYAPIYWV